MCRKCRPDLIFVAIFYCILFHHFFPHVPSKTFFHATFLRYFFPRYFFPRCFLPRYFLPCFFPLFLFICNAENTIHSALLIPHPWVKWEKRGVMDVRDMEKCFSCSQTPCFCQREKLALVKNGPALPAFSFLGESFHPWRIVFPLSKFPIPSLRSGREITFWKMIFFWWKLFPREGNAGCVEIYILYSSRISWPCGMFLTLSDFPDVTWFSWLVRKGVPLNDIQIDWAFHWELTWGSPTWAPNLILFKIYFYLMIKHSKTSPWTWLRITTFCLCFLQSIACNLNLVSLTASWNTFTMIRNEKCVRFENLKFEIKINLLRRD